MKVSKIASFLIMLAVLPMIFWLAQGCEDKPAGENNSTLGESADPRNQTQLKEPYIMTISPSTADVSSVGQQILFTGDGSSGPYTWSVTQPAYGTISSLGEHNRQAMYRCTALGGNQVVLQDAHGGRATAFITSGSGAPTPDTPTISPGDVTVSASSIGNPVVFVASGGTPPYHWYAAIGALGTVPVPSVGQSVNYSITAATSFGTNVVTVVDNNGNSDSVSVIQTP